MSQVVFPSLPGLEWNANARPEFSTRVKRAVSGRELRAAFMQYPLWNFGLSYAVLRANVAWAELQTLCGFFLARQGMFDSFLYAWDQDYTVTDAQFGIGDGTTTQFQLTRSFGGFVEPVQNVNVLTNIKKAGVTQASPANYSVNSTGLVTFTTAPAAAASLTWTGTYYYRVRFLQDVADFNAFMKDLFELKKLEFVGAVGNKV
jgi:uncharacterized protein (TIGR02217 family)